MVDKYWSTLNYKTFGMSVLYVATRVEPAVG